MADELKDYDLQDSANPYVGVVVIVVPNGIDSRKGRAKLSLSVAPTTDKAEALAVVDLSYWPQQIAGITRTLSVSLGNGRTCDPAYPDVVYSRFEDPATKLWRRIFTDGASSTDLGFKALKESICGCKQGKATQASRVSSSPKAELAKGIDAMVGSAVATAFLQRAATEVLTSSNGFGPEHAHLLELASSPDLPWWRSLWSRWISTMTARPEYPSSDHNMFEGITFAGIPNLPWIDGNSFHWIDKFFSQHVGALEFWRSGRSNSPKSLEQTARERFNYLFSEHIESMGHHRAPFVNVSETTDSEWDKRKEAASRKYAGILSYPTLAKFLGLIVDTDVSLECVLSGDPRSSVAKSRTTGLISAKPTPFQERPASGSAKTHTGTGLSQQKDKLRSSFTPVIRESGVPTWTGFVLQTPDPKRNINYTYFGPMESDVTGAEAQSPGDGLLRLGQRMKDGKSRFELSTLDVTNAAEKILNSAEKILHLADTSHEQKVRAETRSFPELLTRGITLHDTDAIQQEKQRDDREKRKSKIVESGGQRILFAEDLLAGYQIDCALGEWKNRDRWRTLMARSLGYGGDIDSAFLALPAIKSQRSRDDGHCRAMVREDKLTVDNPGGKWAHEELFVWTGESLAVPHLNDVRIKRKYARCSESTTHPGIELCPDDLTVTLEYDLPRRSEATYRFPPPLREGRNYMFGARLHFLNGCCLSFEDARERYSHVEKELILGSTSETPFTYRRRAAIHAPYVLLPGENRLVTCSLAEMNAKNRGETITQLVVRSGQMQTDTAQRVLVPPRITFDLAEQGGCFDDDDSPRPKGAFLGQFRAQLDCELGGFPVARRGGLFFPSPVWPIENSNCIVNSKPASPAKAKQPEEQNRGAVFALDVNALRPASDFYPDPLARQVGVRFVNGTDHYEIASAKTQFWSKDEAGDDAAPVLLELKRGPVVGPSHVRCWFDRTDALALVPQKNTSECVQLRKITVVLSPGASIDLELFSIPDGEEVLKRHHGLHKAMGLIGEFHAAGKSSHPDILGLKKSEHADFEASVSTLAKGEQAARDKLVEDLMSHGSLSPVTTSQVLSLVHAVDRPLAPHFERDSTKPLAELHLYPVVITVKAGAELLGGNDDQSQTNPPSGGQVPSGGKTPGKRLTSVEASWQTYVKTQEERPGGLLDRRLWQSEEGGLATFFVGQVLIDRATTGRLRCEAQWREYSPSVVKREGAHCEWTVSAPAQWAGLFQIDDIETANPVLVGKREFGLDQLDLLRTNTTGLRNLAFSFVDGRARYLKLQLIATSRFTNYFPEEILPKKVVHRVGRYEACTEDLERSTASIWVPCTFRPAPPEVDRVLPVFQWTNERVDGGREFLWKRDSILRIFMGREWFSSGEGERLALVLWPPDLLSGNKNIRDADTEKAIAAARLRRSGVAELDPSDSQGKHPLQKFGQYVTRWGADPIHLSGQIDQAISLDRFYGSDLIFEEVNQNKYQQPLLLNLPSSDQESEPTPRKDSATEQLAVSILSYEAKLDGSDGTWFCDIAIDHGDSYFPFVQLGLVRYQPHAVNGLELSYPVPVYAQIPPHREGKVVFGDDFSFDIEVRGIGFHMSNSGRSEDGKDVDFPTMDITLMRAGGSAPDATGPAINWQPAFDRAHHPIQFIDVRPRQRGAELVWTMKIRLPSNRSDFSYAVLIEEYEHMATDIDTKVNDKIVFESKIIKRGPMFSHIIDLRR
jgi:hypothetical protein